MPFRINGLIKTILISSESIKISSTFVQMIFVTGGTGLLGTHVLLEILSRGEKVRALKRKTSDLDYDLFCDCKVEHMNGY